MVILRQPCVERWFIKGIVLIIGSRVSSCDREPGLASETAHNSLITVLHCIARQSWCQSKTFKAQAPFVTNPASIWLDKKTCDSGWRPKSCIKKMQFMSQNAPIQDGSRKLISMQSGSNISSHVCTDWLNKIQVGGTRSSYSNSEFSENGTGNWHVECIDYDFTINRCGRIHSESGRHSVVVQPQGSRYLSAYLYTWIDESPSIKWPLLCFLPNQASYRLVCWPLTRSAQQENV